MHPRWLSLVSNKCAAIQEYLLFSCLLNMIQYTLMILNDMLKLASSAEVSLFVNNSMANE